MVSIRGQSPRFPQRADRAPGGIRIDTPSPIFTSTSVAPAFLAARIARSISAWLILAGRLLISPGRAFG